MERNKEEFLQGLRAKGTITNRATAQVDLINEETRTVPFIMVSNDNAGLRYDWWNDETFEERLDPAGAKFDKLNTFFKDHRRSVDTAIGQVINKRLEDGQIKADVVFGTDDDAEKIYNKYREGILTDVSIGYSINEVITTERKDEPTEVLVTDFEIQELSAVWRGFDSNATIGREAENEAEKLKASKEAEKQKAILRHKRMQRILTVNQLSNKAH